MSRVTHTYSVLSLSSRIDDRGITTFGVRSLSVLAMTVLLSIFISTSAYAQCTGKFDNGLIGHWTMDDTSGTDFTDSANGNDAAYSGGTVVSSSGILATAGDFSGSIDAADAGSDAAFDIATGSVSLWFNTANASTPGTNRDIFSKDDSGNNSGDFGIRIQNAGGNADKLELQIQNGSGSNTIASDNVISADTWTHVVATFGAGGMRLYVDGVLQADTNASTVGMTNAAADLIIGNLRIGQSTDFDGSIDDVRLYERALSADEIEALYSLRSTGDSPAGTIVYNLGTAALEYCNGTDWVHAGIGGYNPPAVYMSDTDRIGSTISGLTDSKKITASFWLNVPVDDYYDEILWADPTNYFRISKHSSDRIQLRFSSSGGQAFRLDTTDNSIKAASGWQHIVFSYDLSDPNKAHFYIDDVLDGSTPSEYDDSIISFSDITEIYLGETTTAAMSLAEFWIDIDTYLDLSVESNRRKFISESGMPMYLGKDGSIPTGEVPEVYLSGDQITFLSNRGSVGSFSMDSGTLKYSSVQPADTLIGTQTINLESGLVSHWALNEITGTVAYDSAGGFDGTMQNSMTAAGATVAGKSGTAMDFVNGSAEYIQTTNDTIETADDVTMSAWIYMKDDVVNNEKNHILWQGDVAGNGGGGQYEFGLSAGVSTQSNEDNDLIQFHVEVDGAGGDTANDINIVSPYETIDRNKWHHVLVTMSGMSSSPSATLYFNGVEVGTDTASGAIPRGTWDTDLRIGADGAESRTFDGYIDEVRIYDRVLNSDEIEALAGNMPGFVMYNDFHNVMQYYNGVEWVAMGSQRNHGLVGHWRLDESGNTSTTVDDRQNSDGVLVSFPANPSSNWTTGIIDGALDFDGVDDVIEVPVTPELDFGNKQQVSVSVWIDPDDVDMTDGSDTIIMWEDLADANGGEVIRMNIFEITGTTWRPNFSIESGGSGYGAAPSSAWNYDSGFYHIVGTFDGANVKIYVNGTEEDSTALTGVIEATADDPLTLDWHIGGGEDPASQRHFNGTIDDVRIYNRALSADEITQLYDDGQAGGQAGVSGTCSNPAKPEGTMIYNTDHNVLQYCNGANWVGVGK